MTAAADADRSARQLDVTIRAGRAAAEQSLGVIGILITNAVKVMITKNFPPQSLPDTPPALRTGGLRLSYSHKVTPSRAGRVAYVTVYSDSDVRQPVPPHKPVVYAAFVEFGTSTMAARPHLRPAVAQVRPLIPGIIRAAWSKGIQSGSAS